MDELQHPIDTDRASAMILLHAQGYTFADMVKPMLACGMLACQQEHRKRPQGDVTICATCENTLLVSWRRHMKAIGATKDDLAEVKGGWFTTHEIVKLACAKNYLQEVVTETTRTEVVEGKEIVTRTVTKVPNVNVAMLRLWVDVEDKIARMRGLNVKNPASSRTIQRRLMRVYEREADGSGAEPAN